MPSSKIKKIFSLVLVLGSLFLAGCATVANQPADALCLPPGITPNIFTAPVVGAAPYIIYTEDGGRVPGVYLMFQMGEKRVVVIYTTTGLIIVDPNPDDKDAPEWVNRRLVTPEGPIRRQPEGPCRWERNLSRNQA